MGAWRNVLLVEMLIHAFTSVDLNVLSNREGLLFFDIANIRKGFLFFTSFFGAFFWKISGVGFGFERCAFVR